MTKSYDHKKIESKWRREWEKAEVFKTADVSDKPKCYVLDMFPYPSGEGLHTGHTRIYTASDVYSRMKRMQGLNVLHPTGWDAFGLPAEQYAIKNKIHPSAAVKKNTDRFREQMKSLGFSYDWEREINTTDKKYYKWTQWAFLKMLEKGLAYESYEPINWCPSCKTGLANEDLEGNACERCGTTVEKKPMRQWVLRITDYADRLLSGLDTLNWPESIKEAQRNWIGKSEGALIKFKVKSKKKKDDDELEVFTTRPDTLFGATYCVMSPEHKLLDEWKDSIENWSEVEAYREEMKKKTEIERTAEGKEKTGVRLLGITAKNPANGEELPVFIADYVLAHYGTGAIMAVPAHDTRDYEFAKKFGLNIKKVIQPLSSKWLIVEKSLPAECVQNLITFGDVEVKEIDKDWGKFFTVSISEKEDEFIDWLKKNLLKTSDDGGSWYANSDDSRKVVFSEIEFDVSTDEGIASYKDYGRKKGVPEEELDVDDSKIFIGYGILVNSGKFDGIKSEDAKKAITEFAGGKLKTTYRLREWVFSRQRYWGEPIPVIHCERCGVVPVPEKDLPVILPDVEFYEPSGTGESPLANIHDWVNVKCPVCRSDAKRETNTMPQWAGSSWYYLRFIDPRNQDALVSKEKEKYWSPVDMYVGGVEHATRHLIYARFWHKFLFDIGVVNYEEPFIQLKNVGLVLGEGGIKMSKRLGNVINPDTVVEIYGADTLRVYEMFMGPFEQSTAWNTESMIGPRRFLEKVWKLAPKVKSDALVTASLETAYHQTIKRVSENIEDFKFNTAVSGMMIFLNELEKVESVTKEMYEGFLKLLTPFAPHMTEELWHDLGNDTFIYHETWPIFDPSKIVSDRMAIAVQVNGKVRATFEIGREIGEEEVKMTALTQPEVRKWVGENQPKKVIYVKDKLVSVVV
ncbi:MAG: class I tRNA ligase family protein [Candidatus Parcubacteria bacterium]|nr:class I tRNA ligase family protein [Candidatus Parcubacteria bacterium]